MTEIITCPKCRRSLQVPEHYLGQTVQCPECEHQFTAASNAISTAPQPSAAPMPTAAPKRRRDEDDRDEEEYRRRRRRFDDDEELEDLITTPRYRHERLPPNRGGLIMALGLVSLIGGWMFCVPVVVGPVAWFLAQQDLRGIRDGNLDPTNENMVRTGQICGIISTIILVGGVGVIALFIFGDMVF
jgi:hypothetical protein